MSNFRSKLLGIAAVATAFAGMSYGQTIACAVAADPTSANPTLRAEGQTEEVLDIISSTPTSCSTTAAVTTTVTVNLNAVVTSKSLTAPAPATTNTDAVLIITQGPAVPATATVYYGTASGQTVTFSGVVLNAVANFTLRIGNVRVNASSLPASTNVTATVSFAFPIASGTNVAGASYVPAGSNLAVGFVLPSLSSSLITGTASGALVAGTIPTAVSASATSTSNSYFVCSGNAYFGSTATPSFVIKLAELFGGAWKSQAANSFTGGEGGSIQGGLAGTGLASNATQIALNFANLPAGSTIAVPTTISSGALVLTVQGGTATTSPAGIAGIYSGAAASLGATSFSGSPTLTITYAVTTPAPSAGNLNVYVPVYLSFPGNSSLTPGSVTVAPSYVPVGTLTGPATTIPTFVASTATALTASAVNSCQTSLLFPFVTNQLGFDTGVAIANTTTDNLATSKLTPSFPSSVAAQTGTCTLSFYGNTAPSPATGVALAAATATASVSVFTISQVAPGFQGYMIASCPFLYAHGFAFITYGLTQNNGIAEGYLAEVLTPGRAPGAGGASEAITF